MKRFLFCYLLLSLLAVGARAQSPSSLYDLPKLIPLSPNAAALEKFGVIPVSYSTGVPDISYPFWNWKRGRLAFAMGLGYHAGGHKVEDMASNVGLGWTLSGLGRVSRAVRGVADDEPVRGYLNTPILPQATTYAYQGEYVYTSSVLFQQQQQSPTIAITQYNTPYSDAIKTINESYLDGEQDVFSFSFPGNSCRFVFDKNKNVVPLEHTNCIVTPVYNGSGYIIAFNITDDKGILYKFEYQEHQNTTAWNDSPSPLSNSVQNYISGWLLTQIIDPMTSDAIVINYVDNANGITPVQLESGFSENQDIALEYGSGTPGIQISSDVNAYTIIGTNDPQPAYITFPDGSRVDFTYGFNRADYINAKALTAFTVKNMQNAVVKTFRLSYSYFTAASGFYPLGTPSGNDYTKRLRLDTVNEVSTDGAIIKPTTFTYNSLPLNPRGSKNIDYWGYNVDPARNNPYYVPTIELADQEVAINPGYGRYLDGANRSPDADYVKAAVLEKIQYPTGGFTTFSYECNKAFSAVNYYENSSNISSGWDLSGFNQPISLDMPGRTAVGVKLVLAVQEFSTRPTPNPNDPQSCLDTQQDGQTVTFVITSTDNTFSSTVQDVYSSFNGAGKTVNIDLPVDKSYNITFQYNASAPCAYTYPFKAVLGGAFYYAPQDKLAGGLRIKKIISNDGYGKNITKEYNYNDDAGHATATLNTIPDFGYHRTTINPASNTSIRHINRGSSPTTTLNYFNGSPVVYTRVQEKEVDGSLTERYYDPLISAPNGGAGYYPPLTTQDFPNLSGLLTRQTVRDNTGALKTDRLIYYNKVQQYHLNPENRNIKTGIVASASGYTATYYVADQYFMYNTLADEILDTLITYENGKSLVSVQNKSYTTGTHYVNSESTTDSRGKAVRTDYQYTEDYAGAAPYSTMTTNNMRANLIKQSNYVDNNLITAVKTNYADWGGGLLAAQTVEATIQTNSPETRLRYFGYDSKANITTVGKENDMHETYLWGYNKQYPVAKITGADYSTVSGYITQSILDNPTSDQQLRDHLGSLRAYLPSTIISTYTYAPLVGVTSETDPTGKTTYYEYDGLNRLKLVRDRNQNIVKRYCYNYVGQQVDCDGNSNTSNPGTPTIYAKLTLENQQGNLFLMYYDAVVRFYSDAACTVPVSVTNVTVNYSVANYVPATGVTTTTTGSYICNGTSAVIYPSLLTFQRSGNITNTLRLTTGTGYTIAP
ncbi:hypothetical protein ACI6Q2_22505 [Chitinophagaceae bacterium LWZ2-11]